MFARFAFRSLRTKMLAAFLVMGLVPMTAVGWMEYSRSREMLINDAKQSLAKSAGEVMRFGGHHFTHAIVVRDGAWQVRRLVLDPAKGAAYLAEHGMFMPEHAEMLSEPGDEVLLAAESREALAAALLVAWPLR